MDGNILVVCNREDVAELVGVLEGQVATSDGGDETLTRFVAERPEVVVVTATLDAGDSRALVSALRSSAPAGSFHIVLIGDARGPIRNALDAADFGVDRFVARPVAAKALRYAVQTGVAAARKARANGEATDAPAAPVAVVPERAPTRRMSTQRAAMITPPTGIPAQRPPTEDPLRGDPSRMVTDHGLRSASAARSMPTLPDPVAPQPSASNPGALAARLDAMLDAAVEDEGRAEVSRRTSGGFSVPMDAFLAAGGIVEDAPPSGPLTAPMSVHDVPTRPVSEFERRVDAALAAAEEDESPQRQSRARTVPPPPPPGPRTKPDSIPPIEVDDADIEELDSNELRSEVYELEPSKPADQSGSHELPHGLEAPVVSEVAGSFDDHPWPRTGTDELPSQTDEWDAPSIPQREPTMILGPGASSPSLSPPPAAALDLTERRPDERWSSTPSVSAMSDEASETPAAPPSGGEFARELRKKMSMMAQRLFRAGDVATPPAMDVRPPHDFRTEIDLAEIGAHAERDEASASVYDLAADATFAGDDHGLPTNPGLLGSVETSATSGTASARTSESGEITRGTADAAVLIARMFTGEFTGKVTFRRPGTEKVIYFDGGRPVFASSNLTEDRMGELLYREGKITAEQYASCRDVVVESGRRMGEILVDRGFLKRRELLPAVRRHVEDIIYSLFAWDAGEYRIVPGDGASGERIRLSRHPAAMVLEGVRRKLDLDTLERLLGPTTTVVEVADRDKAGTVVAVADLQSDERGALASMDGANDLGHIARSTGAPLVTVYHLAWAMVLLGVGTVRRRGLDDDDAPALVGETDLAIDRERVRARHRLVAEADYFALLGVRRQATSFEIRRAYESSRRDFDAEAFPPELRAELGLELAEIGSVLDEAYRVLRDDRLRVAYLSALAE